MIVATVLFIIFRMSSNQNVREPRTAPIALDQMMFQQGVGRGRGALNMTQAVSAHGRFPVERFEISTIPAIPQAASHQQSGLANAQTSYEVCILVHCPS